MNNLEIYKEVSKIAKAIKVDTGGGCQIPKAALMAKLAIDNDLKTFVEIGVYRGRSFFPMAKAMQITGGHAYGIDPYTNEDAYEDAVPAELEAAVRIFFEETDFPSIYPEVISFQEVSGLSSCSTILKTTSSEAARFFIENKLSIDMLHIDGNHDYQAVKDDLENYFPLIKKDGFIVLDDTNWASVRGVLNESLARNVSCFFASETFTILQKSDAKVIIDVADRIADLKLQRYYRFVENCSLEPIGLFAQKQLKAASFPLVSVLLISYNHAAFINEALEGIISQTGDFRVDLIIGDDCSADETLSKINSYLHEIEDNPFISYRILKDSSNLGLEQNYKRCFRAVEGDFLAVCEGDDYWVSPYKIISQLNTLLLNSHLAYCFNDLIMLDEASQTYSPYIPPDEWKNNFSLYRTSDLIRFNFIGNFSCCFYRSKYLDSIPDSFFDLSFADWFFNIYYSQFGFIGRNSELLSVYRKHSSGLWSSKSSKILDRKVYDLADQYNRYLNYVYDHHFREYQSMVIANGNIELQTDLLILDDSFPNKYSSFRLEEFGEELRNIPSSLLLTEGYSYPWAGYEEGFADILRVFKQQNEAVADSIQFLNKQLNLTANAAYCLFLNNAFNYIDILEQNHIPFVFTLYPGGGFGLNDPDSDRKLSRICSSPYFQKVIVTQTITRDYLIERNFCEENQIELIFGCVIPESLVQRDIAGRPYYLDGKDTFDICFAAHKYSQFGLQKGYDIFVDVAHRLAAMYPQFHFHVIGGFDENTFDVQKIRSNIHFYGAVDSDRLQEIFNKMDIILAPNMNDLEFSGTFDGFPTASCITAGLSGSAIFCTDPLGLNQGYFADHEEIEIVPHDSNSIVAIIENYFHNPEALVKLAARGREKIVQLYSREGQIEPRIAILNQLIAEHSVIMEKVEKKLKENRKVVSGMPSSSLVNQAGESTSIEQTEPEPGFLTRVKRKMRNALRYMRYAPLIKRSGFFDAEWYTVRNPDVRHSALSPLHHFILFGGNEGRDPSPYFNSGRYLDAYPDVALAGQNPLIHFLKFGRFEGRNPRP